MHTAFRWEGNDLLLSVHAVPRSKQPGFDGLHGTALRVRIDAAPSDGEANAALIEFLAGAFGVAKRDVTLLAGASSRQKRFRIHAPRVLPPLPGLTVHT